MDNSNIDTDNGRLSPRTLQMIDVVFDPPIICGPHPITAPTNVSNPSNDSNLNFSSQLIPDDEHGCMSKFNNNGSERFFAANTNPVTNTWDVSSTGSIFNEDQNEKLQILAQPKESYRGRYLIERQLANRFIRTENKDQKYEYPTIKIPSWCHSNQQLYIRITLVTVPNDIVPYHCIHPNSIDTPDLNVIRNEPTNSLFFRIYENEFLTREKGFLISLIKKKEDELKSHETFRLFDSNQLDITRVQNIQDAKEKKCVYQLWKSQLVFTIAEAQNNSSIIMTMPHTSVTSIVMTDETVVTPTSPIDKSKMECIYGMKCIPQQGNWIGGDEIVIIMPSPIKRKEYTIYFDFGGYSQISINGITLIDTKTLLFRTPSCPILAGNDNLKVSIIIQDNKSIIPPINFYYITPIKSTINLCSCCQGNSTIKKRELEYDNGESLISQMNQLSVEQKINNSHSDSSSLAALNEKFMKFDKYLHQLRDALAIFVRTNNPSQLFRQTSTLLSTYDGKSSPLHDAIQYGHTELAFALLDIPLSKKLLEDENENGETPLLIAVKLNQWKLIEFILKNRFDFAKQKDKDGNNLFHLLAYLDEDKGVETIKNISTILPNELKIDLLREKNKINQTPMDIAQSLNNTSTLELLIDIGKDS